MRVTISDVAKVANVSTSTVSRVIADSSRISKNTRDRVLKVMSEMNYYPNIIARSLANKSTKIIGVVIPGSTEKALQHPFFNQILRGIATAAQENKYNILISNVSEESEELRAIKEMANGGIAEGIVLLSSRVNDLSIAELKKISFPFVVLGRPEEQDMVNWIDNDNYESGYELAKHFIHLGHRRLAFIGVSKEYIVTLDRLEGYKKALIENGIAVDDSLIVESKFTEDSSCEMVKKLMALEFPPTGIIACDDPLALGAIKALRENCHKVPDDVAVAGFNNVPLADYFTPSLTSVDVRPFELGTNAYELLMRTIKNTTGMYENVIVKSEIVVRNSTLKSMQCLESI